MNKKNNKSEDDSDSDEDGFTEVKNDRVCKFFKYSNNCKFGLNGNGCRFTHPKTCSTFRVHGNGANGCNDRNCTKFHQKVCPKLLKFGNCFTQGQGCPNVHPRSYKKENYFNGQNNPRRHNVSNNVNPWSSQSGGTNQNLQSHFLDKQICNRSNL